MESILTSIKKLLGIEEDNTSFDQDIIMYINSVFLPLKQMGIGPSTGFSIMDDGATWKDYINNDKNLESVKIYIYLKVRLSFDPPSTSSVIESIKNQIQELECRLLYQVEDDSITIVV